MSGAFHDLNSSIPSDPYKNHRLERREPDPFVLSWPNAEGSAVFDKCDKLTTSEGAFEVAGSLLLEHRWSH